MNQKERFDYGVTQDGRRVGHLPPDIAPGEKTKKNGHDKKNKHKKGR